MKARSTVILIITLLFSISAASVSGANQDAAGIWYLEAVYAPEMGSFGEDYFYAAEYGITEMLIILKDGSIEIRHLIYDDRFSEETQPEIMKKLNEIGEISIKTKDGYLLMIGSDNIVRRIYSKTSPEFWYELPLRTFAAETDFDGKWNLVTVYETASRYGDPYSFGNTDFFNTEFRACLKNWTGNEVFEKYYDFHFTRTGTDNQQSKQTEFMNPGRHALDEEFVIDGEPTYSGILWNGFSDTNEKTKITYQELHGDNYLVEFEVKYTPEELEDQHISHEEGTFPYHVRLYRRSLSDLVEIFYEKKQNTLSDQRDQAGMNANF